MVTSKPHRNIDADMARFAHLRTPSLLTRARALATVRVWKRWLEHQAHSRSDSRRSRASSHDGGWPVNRPPSTRTMLLSRHTRPFGVVVDPPRLDAFTRIGQREKPAG